MNWQKVKFTEALTDLTGGNTKIQQSDYLNQGQFPIIDQGKEFIAGFTNDELNLCKVNLPVIVFGDHTRALKYIDFPFAMGADGTKVLKPKIDASTKYLFRYLQNLQIPSAGYSRHFKFLKEFEIPLPPLDEQKRIAAILDAADALRRTRRESLARLDELAQSLFLEMFGDPATNPKGWEIKKFAEIGKSRLGKMLDARKQTGKDPRPYLRNANVQWHRVDLSSIYTMDFDEKDRKTFRLSTGDLLICEGGEPGRAAIWNGQIEEIYYQKALHRVQVNSEQATGEYLVYLLESMSKKGLLADQVTSATIAHLTGEKLATVKIPLPPLPLQQSFARQIEELETIKSRARAQLLELDALFASLQERAFSGQL